MGKGGNAVVYDFLYSIDYGVCLGPIDSVNEIFVKDRPIFCGTATGRVDMKIDLPKLFGGDTAEGGCVGVVEVYPGSDFQIASEELMSRLGGVFPEDVPGYRGIAHLFFRGGEPSEEGESPSGVERGFRWTTNNPYFPATRASITRLSRTLGGDPAIWPFLEYDADGNPVAVQAFMFGSPDLDVMEATGTTSVPEGAEFIFDLGAVEGFNLGRVDSGAGYVTGRMSWDAEMLSGGPALVAWFFSVSFYDGDGSLLGTGNLPGTYQDSGSKSDTSFEASWAGPMPPGTRRIGVNPNINPFIPLFTVISNAQLFVTANFNYGNPYEENPAAHCDKENGSLALLPNANPAHVIHEVMVNAEWGKGEDPANLDTDSFLAAAAIYRADFMGIAAVWTREDHIDNFIQEILNHTNSLFFQDPETGKWNLKPIRADYDASIAPLLDPSNCRAKDRKRRGWGEIVNELVVKYTDPRTEKLVAVAPAHNLSSIAIQGGVISDVREYALFRDPYTATLAADREVRASGYPLFSTKLECDRRMWRTKPGDVVRFTWPEDGISEMVLRVMEVERGNRSDRTITLHCVEDVYALEQTTYFVPQASEWTSDRQRAEPLNAEFAMTAPLPVLQRVGLDQAEVDAEYPGVGAMLLAASDVVRVIDIEAWAEVTLPTGASEDQAIHVFPPTRSALTTAILPPESLSTLPAALVSKVTLNQAAPGVLLLLGGAEGAHEIVMLDSYNPGSDTWTVARGVWDTLPETWPVGTRVWRFYTTSSRLDPTERAAGETVVYRFLPRTTVGRLAYESAADVNYTATERPHLPFRPADCQLDGAGFGLLDYTGTGQPATVTATWANRHRGTEDSLILRWDASNATPEEGQTTVLRVLDSVGAEANEITGLTGTSYAMTVADFAGVEFGSVEFYAERDGLRSRVAARRFFDFRQGGYGVNYGAYYGP